MPFYGLFRTESPYRDLWWRLCCKHYLLRGSHSGHYVFVPWSILTSPWVMMLLWMSMVTSKWAMTLLWAHIMMLQSRLILLGPTFIIYYYAQLWYFCFHSKIFKSVNQEPVCDIVVWRWGPLVLCRDISFVLQTKRPRR